MAPSKQDILRHLQAEILPLQGYRPCLSPAEIAAVDAELGPVSKAFPNGVFPTGAIHEFLSDSPEDAAATGGFISALLGTLLRRGGVGIWIATRRTLFPPALKWYGVDPERIVFVDLANNKDALWAMEEALKCEGLAAVVGEIPEIDFTASRKLQLAVEKSRVSGFLLRHQPRKTGVVAAVSRWRIGMLPSLPVDGLPGLGFPRWKTQLVKVRNGRPGEWIVEWANQQFLHAGDYRHAALHGPSPGAAEIRAANFERLKTG